MPLSMYEASVPIFLQQLGTLSGILEKAAAHAAAEGIDPQVLLDARLAPDMFALPRQVQIATDGVKGAVGRLGNVEMPSFPDTETSFAELQERIAKTVAFVKSVPAEAFEGSEEREIVLTFGPRRFEFVGRTFLQHFALPNFLFHVTTAYAILRAQGVVLGKGDYLGVRPVEI